MPTYQIDPDKLLAAADLLSPAQVARGRPPYTAHRRASSTAYYAVFHAVTARAVDYVLKTAPDDFRRRVRRWINHADIAEVCRWISTLQGTGNYQVPKHIRDLLAPPGGPVLIDSDTVAIADGFLELYEKRMEADFDHFAVFTRADTLGHIALARQTVHRVETAGSAAVQAFFGLIAFQARIQRR